MPFTSSTFDHLTLPSNDRVVILGCGMGGLATSSLLAERAPSASITIVEQKKIFEFPPSFPLLAMGRREPGKVRRALSIPKKRRIRLINDRVRSIVTSSKLVKTESEELHYDHLVISMGVDYSLGDVPGLERYAHQFYDFDSAMKLRDALEGLESGRLVIGISRLPIKCPVAPYGLALLLQDHFARAKKKITMEFFTPEPHPAPAAGPVIGKQVERLLAAKGIAFRPKVKLSKVEKEKIVFEEKTELPYDLLIIVPPHKCPSAVVEAGLTDSSGWVPVSPQTLATRFENVYAIGDVTAIETPHAHVPFLPKSGSFALGQAEVVSNNIAMSITGKGERKIWDGTGSCFLEVNRGESAMLRGEFLSNPPRLEFHPPRKKWQVEKTKLEEYWMKYRF
ncbi:NAD(P)/FAD-dependent oxidoreductase [Candidatus Bathyarchaeota archaeon]|nr:MAG: NAD(P)/FAD-dependent oxidoreductase [Candidatus Bathyarchaeota archaeon]